MGFTIGILQFSSTGNVRENIGRIEELIRRGYEKADLILLPEYSMMNILGGMKPEDVYKTAESIEDSSYLDSLTSIAMKYSVYIVTHFIEKSEEPPKCYSSSILLTPSGDRKLLYRKIHLFDAYGYRESEYFIPGDRLSEIITVNDVKIAIAICFDIRFPELFRCYALSGVETVLVHMGWVKGPLKEETLEFLARSRAHENTYWIVVADQCGRGYVGRSMVIDPYGVKKTELGFLEDYTEYYIDKDIVYKARETIPVLEKARKWSIVLKNKTS